MKRLRADVQPAGDPGDRAVALAVLLDRGEEEQGCRSFVEPYPLDDIGHPTGNLASGGLNRPGLMETQR